MARRGARASTLVPDTAGRARPRRGSAPANSAAAAPSAPLLDAWLLDTQESKYAREHSDARHEEARQEQPKHPRTTLSGTCGHARVQPANMRSSRCGRHAHAGSLRGPPVPQPPSRSPSLPATQATARLCGSARVKTVGRMATRPPRPKACRTSYARESYVELRWGGSGAGSALSEHGLPRWQCGGQVTMPAGRGTQ